MPGTAVSTIQAVAIVHTLPTVEEHTTRYMYWDSTAYGREEHTTHPCIRLFSLNNWPESIIDDLHTTPNSVYCFPQLISLDGGPSSMLFGGVWLLFPHPIVESGGPSPNVGGSVPRFSLFHPISVEGGPNPKVGALCSRFDHPMSVLGGPSPKVGGVVSRFSLSHVTMVVGLPSQKLSVGVGLLATASALASRFSLPQLTIVLGGPREMSSG